MGFDDDFRRAAQCDRDLNSAQAWDPTSDKLPEVVAMRKTLALKFEAKPRFLK